jgi:hypothetical protein
MKMKNKNSILYVLLGVIIIISLLLVYFSSSGSVEEEYSVLLDPSITVEELSNMGWRENLRVLSITYTNSNAFFPKRVELSDVYACIYNSNTDELLLSEELSTDSYRYSLSSDLFNLNTEYVDISADSSVEVIYSTYVRSQEISVINRTQGNFYIEFKEVTSNERLYNEEEEVCRGNIDSRTLEI